MDQEHTRRLVAETVRATLEDVNARLPDLVSLAHCNRRSKEILDAVRSASNRVIETHETVRKMGGKLDSLQQHTTDLRIQILTHLAHHDGEVTGETRRRRRAKSAAMWAGILIAGVGSVSGLILGILKAVA